VCSIENNDAATIEEIDLSVTKLVNNHNPSVGEQITFSLQISNAGPDTATNVQITPP